ncbi:Hypothetical protein SRAE_1000057400 [Strongyloides ratti]|uniref:Uncharacterized protein n=1 Tax=Strongyloides ratti TaxID=34506 RepID=A0A090KY07_STRRB|nr:Hypothetical protein SRAE_1000057400 [Strongyloides ratti]CEF62301.1 Hypothetical protein SRAE_1000057400 [Strongyloides ratti]
MKFLLTTLLFLFLTKYITGDLSHSYLNRQCKSQKYSNPFRCPEFNSDLVRIDIATFYQPISDNCSSSCFSEPSYKKKVLYNKDWIILHDWSAAYKVNSLLYNPHCYPEGTFVVDGNIPVSLLKDRVKFNSTFNYIIKEGAPLISFLPTFGRHDDLSMAVEEKEFLMFLTLYLMKNTTDYEDESHQRNTKFYDIATDSKLKTNVTDIGTTQKLFHSMYFEAMEMLIESTEMKWNQLCETASSDNGQFYEEVMAIE